MINSTERSDILVFNCYLCHVSFLLTCYVCSTKIGEISDISKCFENFVSQTLGVLTRIYAAELRRYLDSLENVVHYLLMDLSHNDIIKGWAFTFDRDNLRWFAIILSQTIQKKGIGRAILKHLVSEEKHLSAWVIDNDRYIKSNGQPYLSPLSFYLKLGCEVSKKEASKSGDLSVVRINVE